jgi:hypothetical protein
MAWQVDALSGPLPERERARERDRERARGGEAYYLIGHRGSHGPAPSRVLLGVVGEAKRCLQRGRDLSARDVRRHVTCQNVCSTKKRQRNYGRLRISEPANSSVAYLVSHHGNAGHRERRCGVLYKATKRQTRGRDVFGQFITLAHHAGPFEWVLQGRVWSRLAVLGAICQPVGAKNSQGIVHLAS